VLERQHPDLIVTTQDKSVRPKKVLIDWSQNTASKTTVSVYSMRARDRPTASTPVLWDQDEASVEAATPRRWCSRRPTSWPGSRRRGT
jgi:bifunctional non-homologous end joining protein LigD